MKVRVLWQSKQIQILLSIRLYLFSGKYSKLKKQTIAYRTADIHTKAPQWIRHCEANNIWFLSGLKATVSGGGWFIQLYYSEGFVIFSSSLNNKWALQTSQRLLYLFTIYFIQLFHSATLHCVHDLVQLSTKKQNYATCDLRLFRSQIKH